MFGMFTRRAPKVWVNWAPAAALALLFIGLSVEIAWADGPVVFGNCSVCNAMLPSWMCELMYGCPPAP